MVNDGVRVAKYNHDFDDAHAVHVETNELDRRPGDRMSFDDECRETLMARFLSQSEGFAVAAQSLGGSFAGHRSLKGVKRN
jgi:hypothetical protein